MILQCSMLCDTLNEMAPQTNWSLSFNTESPVFTIHIHLSYRWCQRAWLCISLNNEHSWMHSEMTNMFSVIKMKSTIEHRTQFNVSHVWWSYQKTLSKRVRRKFHRNFINHESHSKHIFEKKLYNKMFKILLFFQATRGIEVIKNTTKITISSEDFINQFQLNVFHLSRSVDYSWNSVYVSIKVALDTLAVPYFYNALLASPSHSRPFAHSLFIFVSVLWTPA